jgi:hypothetical protein
VPDNLLRIKSETALIGGNVGNELSISFILFRCYWHGEILSSEATLLAVPTPVHNFRLIFAYTTCMLQGPSHHHAFVLQGLPREHPCTRRDAALILDCCKCPLCGEHRRYLPDEIFQGNVSYLVAKQSHHHNHGAD